MTTAVSSPRARRQRTPRSSRPVLTHGEYFEDVMLRRSGKAPQSKPLTQQFYSTSREATTRRRSATLADPWRLAYARW